MRTRPVALALAVPALLGTVAGGLVAHHHAPPRTAAAAVESVCLAIPEYLGALDFTLTQRPVPGGTESTDETAANLRYFSGMVRLDAQWCETGLGDHSPELVQQTLLWHFGNASVALQRYQESVGLQARSVR